MPARPYDLSRLTPAFASRPARLKLLILAIGFNLGAVASVVAFPAVWVGAADIPGWVLAVLLACWPAAWATDRIVDSTDHP